MDFLSDIRIVSESKFDKKDGFIEEILADQKHTDLPDETVMPDSATVFRPVSADYRSNRLIEDFTPDHTGMKRFFAALNSVNHLKRPVRIAFIGDSFIEGDILTCDFRAKMQERFGGRGVGFIPATSEVMQFRPTIKQSAGGWKTYSIIKDKSKKYVLSGLLFEPEKNEAFVRFQTVGAYPRLNEVSSLKILYASNKNTSIRLTGDAGTIDRELPPAANVMQYELQGNFTRGKLQFLRARGLQVVGLALEDNNGVVVDNFSLRGNSGVSLSALDRNACRQLQAIRPYDLIILQFGLNVAGNSTNNYNWYKAKMKEVIAHLQNCFPDVDILLLGVSDRSYKRENKYVTTPSVVPLLRAQQQIARDAGITFWSVFAAMGGANSMVKYVQTNRASKDYTHLNFRGGREIADALYKAILLEKEKYDDDEKLFE